MRSFVRMRSFEIFVEPSSSLDCIDPPPAADIGSSGRNRAESGLEPRSSRRLAACEVLDLFVQGGNVTARVTEKHASCVLRDLAYALAGLSRVTRGKRIVHFYEDAWELCVERLGNAAAL